MDSFFGGAFLDNFLSKIYPVSNLNILGAGLIPLMNLLVSIFIGAGLFMVFIIFAVRRVLEIGGRRILISTEFFDMNEQRRQK